LWVGGWLAAVLVTSSARDEPPQVRVRVAALVARVQTVLVGPGALLTVGSGILWTMALTGGGGIESRVAPIGTSIMTGTGILGGILVAVLAIPAALKLKAVAVTSDDGRVLPVFDQFEKRLNVVSAIAGVCALVSLFAAVLAP
jgi:hypothetical protein